VPTPSDRSTVVRRRALAVAHGALIVSALAVVLIGAGCAASSATVPGAPTELAAEPLDGAVGLRWALGDDGGSPILDHAYSLDDGETWQTFEPPVSGTAATIAGLENGVVHALRLRAVNAVGAGEPSPTVDAVAAVRSYVHTVEGPSTVSVVDVAGMRDGSVIVVGQMAASASFAGIGTLPGVGNWAGFVARVDASGAWDWATPIEGPGFVLATGVVPHGDGAVVVGSFLGAVSFGSAGAVDATRESVFVARIGLDGAWAWVRTADAGATGYVVPSALARDGNDGLVVVGAFGGTVAFGAAGDATTERSFEGFVARMSSDGTWSWATGTGGAFDTALYGVDVAVDGSIVVAGETLGAQAIAGLPDVAFTVVSDTLVAGLNDAGAWTWALGAGGPGTHVAADVVALEGGGAVVVGRARGPATFGAVPVVPVTGSDDGFVAGIGVDGSWAWARGLGASVSGAVSSVTIDGTGAVAITGLATGPTSFGGVDHEPIGAPASYLARLGGDGTWLDAALIDGDTSVTWPVVRRAVGDGLVVAGGFNGSMILGGSGIASPLGWDGFVWKTSPALE
jgi:hypothetical protein